MLPTRRHVLASGAVGMATLLGRPALAAENGPGRLPHAHPEELGFDPKQLQIAYDLLARWTDGPNAPVPGGAILVGRHGKVVPTRFFGRQGPEADAPPIRPDGLFLMASITKPITYIAAMQLVERGLLNLTDPVVRYVPEFRDGGKESVLVRHLFTHTSGLPDMPPGNLDLRKNHRPLAAFVDSAVRDTVLQFKPGTRVSYQSCGTLIVAEIVRRLTGRPIAEVVRREVFEPLGLKSTGFGAKGFPRDRLVRVEERPEEARTSYGWNSPYWQDFGAPWGGMFSTPEDFAVICQVMLSGGSWNGVRVLSSASVRAMTTNRLGELPDLPEAVARTQPWGLGWRLNHPGTAGSWGDLLGPAVFGHTGATGTMVWMDPSTGMFCVLLTTALREKAPWRLVHLSNALAVALVRGRR